MHQSKHSDRQRRKILDTSYQLFLREGYTRTTVRKIIAATGLTTGTLYHFFRNKEDILVTLMNESFNDTIRAVNTLNKKCDDPVLSYALDIAAIALPLYADREILSLYSVFFTAPESSTMMIKSASQRLQNWFRETHPEMSYNDYYFRVLSLKGFIQSCLHERIHGDFRPGYHELYAFLAEMYLNLFNVPPDRIKTAIEQALALLSSNNIMIFGHRSDKILQRKAPDLTG